MPERPDMPEQDDRSGRLAGPEEVAFAVEILSRGGIVAFPTETVYGLGAHASNEQAVRRIFALKGRPATNPLIVHVGSEDLARQCVRQWTLEARKLARMFWPGPLTLILPRSDQIPDVVTGGGDTVAVRCPDHHLTLALLETFAQPLVGPSANPSGRISPTTADHVRQSFGPDEVYILDGGPCRGGIESTVLSLAGPVPRILRPGLISAEELEIVLGAPVEHAEAQLHTGEGPAPAPGMIGAHYAPRARSIMFHRDMWPEVLAGVDGPVAVLSISGLAVPQGHTVIQMPSDAHQYAANLYAALRRADALQPALIAIEQPPGAGARDTPAGEQTVWIAVMDRLKRATAG